MHAGYGQSEGLHGLNFNLAPAEIIVVVGRNGMGKTTLMKSLMGMLPVKAGQIELDGVDIARFKSYKHVVSGIEYVPEGRMIFFNMTVQETIETGLFAHNTTAVPPDIYTLFPVLQEMKSRRGGGLSGGQQQMLAIARELVTNLKVLLLDEPTEGIQPSIILELARTLKRIRDERGLSINASEPVLSFALDISDRILVLEGGNIMYEDARVDVDQENVARYLAV